MSVSGSSSMSVSGSFSLSSDSLVSVLRVSAEESVIYTLSVSVKNAKPVMIKTIAVKAIQHNIGHETLQRGFSG